MKIKKIYYYQYPLLIIILNYGIFIIFNVCLILKKVYEIGNVYSACFIYDNNKFYIVSSKFDSFEAEPIKVFKSNRDLEKTINDSFYDELLLLIPIMIIIHLKIIS